MAGSANPIFNDARVFFRRCLGHPKEDAIDYLFCSMAGAHLSIAETLFNIYSKADKVSKKDEQDFAEFAFLGVGLLEHHHWIEENYVFPALEPEFSCPAIQEHKTFHNKLENLEDYLLDVLGHEKVGHFETKISPRKKKVPYDSVKLKQLMEELVGPLFVHLKAEVGYLQPENVRKTGLSAYKVQTMILTAGQHMDRSGMERMRMSRWSS